MMLRVALLACILARPPRVMADGTCAAITEGVCLENGFPTTGVNVDDDCCALAWSASCAEGYEYSAGAPCDVSFSGARAYSTCCTPCDGPDCYRGKGAECAAPDAGLCMVRELVDADDMRVADSVDDSCCARAGAGWCASGHQYEQGDACEDPSHGERFYTTCCTPCNSTSGCDDGPGNDGVDELDVGALAGMIIPAFICCACAVSGVAALAWNRARNGQRARGARTATASDMMVMQPMNVQGSVVHESGEYEGVNQVEMSELPSYEQFMG